MATTKKMKYVNGITQYAAKKIAKYVFGDHYSDFEQKDELLEWWIFLYEPPEELKEQLLKDMEHFIKYWGKHIIFKYKKRE